jgi:K(+)-stimulated pyrophosphate-energized sodium pump
MGKDIRKRTDALDAAGNTTAAIGKGFAIGSAALTSLALTSAFITRAEGALGKDLSLELTNPHVLAGLLVGAALPFAFSAMTMKSVGKAAFAMIEEVRRQFRTIPGLMEGKARAEYAKCVDISTQASIREMIAPGLLVIISPLAVGFLFGVQMLAGLLIGSLIVGVMLAISMANSGGAWDNAKKYIETGVLGGKGSDTHKAAVVGDTVGDPFKDTSGPALNILIKLMAIISLVFAAAFATNGGILIR